MSGNQALNVNYGIGGVADLSITDHGSNWYWAVCAVMAASTLAFIGMSMGKRRSHRIFHYITASITLVAAISYFSMAANLGQTAIEVEFPRPNSNVVYAAGTREIFYVRYIDWFVTTPLLLLDLCLTAGIPFPTIAITLLVDEIMIITGLVGALTRSTYKWGFWTFGMVALLFVAYSLVIVGRSHARALGTNPLRVYNMCGVLTVAVWFLYPIAWGLSEGGNVIHPDSEAIFYGILDIIAKPVFGFLLLFGHRNITPEELHLKLRDEENSTHTEKKGFFSRKSVGSGTTAGNNGNTTTTV